MPGWTTLSGAPRLGQAAGGASGPDEAVRAARRTAWAASVAVAWALGGLAAAALPGVAPATFVALGLAPLAALALLLFALQRRGEPSRPGLLTLAGLAGTGAIAAAVAGHVLHGSPGSDLALVPARAGEWLLLALVALVVPLLAAAHVRACGLAVDASGRASLSPARLAEALARAPGDDPLAPPPWRRLGAGAARGLAEGLALPGLLALDLAATAATHVGARLRGHVADRLHAEITLEALAAALPDAGAQARVEGRTLHAQAQGGGAVRVRRARLHLPPLEAATVLDLQGRAEDVRALRRLVEGPLAPRALMGASRAARRWERRLDRLAREVRLAETLEERGALLEEADRLRRALDTRDLAGDERVLLAWKEAALRADLAHRLLSGPVGARPAGRTLAAGPSLTPPLAQVLDAGGLGAVRALTFVPYWIVPVRTPWGEDEIAVNALTGRADLGESRIVLDAARESGPALLLDLSRAPTFLPAPAPSAALLRSLRASLRADARVPEDVATGERPVDVVFVPFLATKEGHVNALTGEAAPDLGPTGRVALAS